MKNLCIYLFLFCPAFASAQKSYTITSADGVKLRIQEFGTGKPLIILAGGPGLNAIYMDSVWENLSPRYRCIVPDQRGTGGSLLSSVDSASLTMDDYVNDLEALRRHLGVEQLTLVGQSWGGMFSLEYASKNPRHVQKLVLLGPGGPTDKFFTYFGDNIEMRLHEEDVKEAEMLDSLKQSDLKAIWPGYFFSRERALVSKSMVTDEIHGQKDVNKFTLNNFVSGQAQRVALLKNYKGEVSIIQGRQDPVGESTAYEIKEILPQSNIYFIEKAGHFPWLESKDAATEFF